MRSLITSITSITSRIALAAALFASTLSLHAADRSDPADHSEPVVQSTADSTVATVTPDALPPAPHYINVRYAQYDSTMLSQLFQGYSYAAAYFAGRASAFEQIGDGIDAGYTLVTSIPVAPAPAQ